MTLGNFIDGAWGCAGGDPFQSVSPADEKLLWRGNGSTEQDVDHAFSAARKAFHEWSQLALTSRIAWVKKYQEIVKANEESFARLISEEMGKPLWESKTEVAAVAGKVDLAIESLKQRRNTTTMDLNGVQAVTRYKPHGVLGVLGPFNLPAHLPNGHIVPALLAGNTIVFKPSELTPKIAEAMVGYWQQAELPPGVLNLVQGTRETGIAITGNSQLDGLLFTGSSRAGIAINQSLSSQPQKIVALEMGGNNPLIVHEVDDLNAAAYQTILSAFITSGQRCTCARRLILIEGLESRSFVDSLIQFIERIRVGYFDDPQEPFMGPVISKEIGVAIQSSWHDLIQRGAGTIRQLGKKSGNDALLTPGVIDVTGIDGVEDEEIFGPLLQIIRVESFQQAIEVANRTRYGLSAGLLSNSTDNYRQFVTGIRAGVVNWNRQTTGASGKLPFGGCGLSGNHRPSGFFAADYCSYPVASLESENLRLPEKLLPGLE